MPVLRPFRTTAGILGATAIAAIDCLSFRAAWGQSKDVDPLLVASLLPMGNVLSLAALLLLISPARPARFMAGFLGAGSLAAIAFACCWYWAPTWLAGPMDVLDEYFYANFLLGRNPQLRHYPYQFGGISSYTRFAAYFALVAATPTSLMLNLALAGGLASGRLARAETP
jgi:hypothetical protein